ncbi:hypothetical protein [Planctomonas sp. JC2975]|uniref:hypothetical protein n=1 Tax=Planctomonas sp. JC2975 TaxID=2729626 RepID=UPI001F10CECB|nr:hypothetical protein [Planctomonas sp. JC2975]
MADFHVYRDRLEIRLTRAEKMLSLRRDDLVVPRESIRSVAITADPWIWIRGVRAPGNSIPLTLAVGTWKFHGGKDFLVLKGKQRSAVVIDIEQPDPDQTDADQTDAAQPDAPEAADQSAGGTDAATGPDAGAATAAAPSAAKKAKKAEKAKKGSSKGASKAGTATDDDALPDDGDLAANARVVVADGFARVIVSTQHASKLVEALRDIRPGSDSPVDKVIG